MLPKRLHSLDVARGFAALSVVVWHWQMFFYESGGLPDSFRPQSQPFYAVLQPFYDGGAHLAVSFFFLLSGFVFFWLYCEPITQGRCSALRFAWFRFARLYPLHLATLCLVATLQVIYACQQGGYFAFPFNDAYHFVLNLFFASHWGFERGWSFNAPTWSVSIEIALYTMFYLFVRLSGATNRGLWIAVLASFLLAKSGLDHRWGAPALAFLMGGVTFRVVQRYLASDDRKWDGLIIAATAGIWLASLFIDSVSEAVVHSKSARLLFLFPMSVAALVLLELKIPTWIAKLSWVGDITYSSYLIHFPLQIVFVVVATEFGLDRTLFLSPLCFLVFFAVLVITSLLVFHWFERPAQRWLRSRFFAWEGAPVRPRGAVVSTDSA